MADARLNDLLTALVEIERQRETASHSDQQMLDQAWDDCMQEIEALEDILAAQMNTLVDDRPDAEESSPGYDGADEI